MRVKLVLFTALLLVVFPVIGRADFVNVYTVGSNPPGNALDGAGNNVGGIPLIAWNHVSPVNAGAGVSGFLTIVAEGIDGGATAPGAGELDQVYFNGVLLGNLVQQDFYQPLFNLNPGPGALPNFTLLTVSVYDVSALLVAGINLVEVHVDPGNWVNEIETSDLTVRSTPEPASLLLLGAGISGLAFARRRKTGV